MAYSLKSHLKFPWKKPYLLVITNLFCNHKCSYCIQQKSSLDVRLNPKKIDVKALVAFLKKNPIDHSIKLMGGESTLHPDFEELMDELVRLYAKLTITTNVNGKWYEDFPQALKKIQRWGQKVKWNTTYHPAWMDADLYIERIKKMREAGVRLDQITTTDTPDLTDPVAERLVAADIGWSVQTFTGRTADGRLVPQTWKDVNTKFPQLYDPSKYINHYQEYTEECEDADSAGAQSYRREWVRCTTSRFLIGPDNLVYPCHRHLYTGDKRYACGDIHDTEMASFKFKWNHLQSQWALACDMKCNPCDFKSVGIKSLGKPVKQATAQLQHGVTG